MSIENSNVIDFISLDPAGNAVLTISDHLEWNADNEHLLLLQEKLNAYLSSIEGGDLYKKYPKAKGRKIIISLANKYSPDEEGQIFLSKVKTLLESAGYAFHQKLVDQSSYEA